MFKIIQMRSHCVIAFAESTSAVNLDAQLNEEEFIQKNILSTFHVGLRRQINE